MQAVLITCILCVDLVLSVKYSPYTVKSLNFLEVLCTMSAIVVVNCGLLIHTGQFRTDGQRSVVVAIILLLILACISISVGIFLVEIKIKIQNQLMRGLAGQKSFDDSSWMSKQIGGDNAPAKLHKSSYLREAFATIGSRNNSGVLQIPHIESPGGVSRVPSTRRDLETKNGSEM
ncbi:hypothetical protein BKA69DRAFT_1098727, partial [Paraphysoderma sedebokerense]